MSRSPGSLLKNPHRACLGGWLVFARLEKQTKGRATAHEPPRHAGLSPTPARARHGYTLVELLIVVTIIGLMASVVLPSLNSDSGIVSLEAMARTLAADLRIARQAAVQYNASFVVTLDVKENAYDVARVTGSGPGITNVLAADPASNRIDLDHFGAERSGRSQVTLGGAALKVSKANVTDVTFGPTGGTGPTRTEDTVIWLAEGTGSNRRSILITVSWITGTVTVGDVLPFPEKLNQPEF